MMEIQYHILLLDGPNGFIAIWQENNRNRGTKENRPQHDTNCHLWDLIFYSYIYNIVQHITSEN